MATTIPIQKASGLSRELLIGAYRTMYLSRRLDDKEIQLKRQNRAYFQISGVGHEAINVATALHLKPSYDWFFPYYRDRAFCLQIGMTVLDMLLQSVGAKNDPSSGGRQMPSHWSSKKLHIVSQSSATGTQVLHAVGAATFHWMPFSSGLVEVGGEPGNVPELLVRSIAARVAEIWQAGGLVFDGLKKGDRVFIREGMFEGYRAIFDARLPGSERVRVLLRMLNDRYLPLELGLEFIEKEKQGALSHTCTCAVAQRRPSRPAGPGLAARTGCKCQRSATG
jgi:hypothetical protein